MTRSQFLVALASVAAIADTPAPTFRGKRAHADYTHELSAPPVVIFPLLCPVREYEWIEEWKCDMIYSDSGVAEPGCIFQTGMAPAGRFTWYTTRYEPPLRIEFLIINPDLLTRLRLTLKRTANGSSLHWEREFTGLSEAGNATIGPWNVERDRVISQKLQYFVTTGKMLRKPARS